MGNNIKMDLLEICSEGLDWIDMDRVRDSWWDPVNIVMSLQVPHNTGNFLTR
jgi:hypothetical protein